MRQEEERTLNRNALPPRARKPGISNGLKEEEIKQ
jgi:hypothetical protein